MLDEMKYEKNHQTNINLKLTSQLKVKTFLKINCKKLLAWNNNGQQQQQWRPTGWEGHQYIALHFRGN